MRVAGISPILMQVVAVARQRDIASARIGFLVAEAPQVRVICRDIEDAEPLPHRRLHVLVPRLAAVLQLNNLSLFGNGANSGLRKRCIGVASPIRFESANEIVRNGHKRIAWQTALEAYLCRNVIWRSHAGIHNSARSRPDAAGCKR